MSLKYSPTKALQTWTGMSPPISRLFLGCVLGTPLFLDFLVCVWKGGGGRGPPTFGPIYILLM